MANRGESFSILLPNLDLNMMHNSPNIVRELPLGRPRRRWEDNIIMNLKEIDINTRNWADSAQDRVD